MPNEPQKRAEELLQAYARKRQDDAGAPLDLHPANRRLLQDEVARVHRARRGGAGSWFSGLLTFWPRLTMAATVFVALGLVVWVVIRSSEKPLETVSMAKLQEQDVKMSEAHFKEKAVREPAITAPVAVSSGSESDRQGGFRRARTADNLGVKLAEEALIPGKDASRAPKPTGETLRELAQQRADPGVPRDFQPADERRLQASADKKENKPSLAPRRQAPVQQDGAVVSDEPAKDTSPGSIATLTTSPSLRGATSELELARRVTTTGVAGDREHSLVLAVNEPTTANYFAPTTNQNMLQADSFYAFNFANANSTNTSALPLLDTSLGRQTLLSYGASLSTNALRSSGQRELNRSSVSRPSQAQANSENLPRGPLVAATDTEQPARKGPAGAEALSRTPAAQRLELAKQYEANNRQLAAQFQRAEAAGNSLAQQRSRFRRLETSEPTNAAERAREASVAVNRAQFQNVLNSFELVQTDDRIEIRDADGSIYNGIVVSSPLSNARDQVQLRLKREALQPDGSVPRPIDQVGQLNTQNAASLNVQNSVQNAVAFRVLGTNRSLKQMVILEAQLSSGDNTADARGGFGGAQNSATQLPPNSRFNALNTLNSPQLQNGAQSARIQVEGNLRVGTVETQLRAVQVPAE